MIKTLRSVVRLAPLEWNATKRRLNRAANVDDLREMARRRLPHGVFDYFDGAAEDEITLARNIEAFRSIGFRPRVMRDISSIDTSTSLFGQPLPIPLVLSPTGFSRIAVPDGELAVARAAERAGLPYTLSTLGTRTIEEVAAVSAGRKWFQVYVWNDRGLVRSMLERADAAGYEAIVLTVDAQVFGRRERDVRRGFTLPPKIGLGTFVDGIMHPGWTLDFLRGGPITFSNLTGSTVGDGSTAISLSEYVSSQFDKTLSWDDLEWFRSLWSGRIVVKGIQTVEDARIAADLGVDAIALSNHGGRQLDGAPSVLSLVAPVADELAGSTPILCDGGVRRGSDIVKAVALGATAAMAGRAYLYGLGAAGERGVDHALAMLASGVHRTMELLGCERIDKLTRDYLDGAGQAATR